MRKLNLSNFIKNKYLIISFLLLIVVILLFLFLPKRKIIQVDTTSPLPNSLSSSLVKPITITFVEELTSREKENLSIEINPSLEFSQQWIDNKTLNLTPKFVFKEKTTYNISIYFNQKPIYHWSFTSPYSSQVDPKEAAEIQGYLDPAGEAMKEAYQERPWLKSLPIQTKSYSIVYLASEQSIRVLMKIDVASSFSREEQILQIKSEVPEKLREIGVDLNKEKIYYTFTP